MKGIAPPGHVTPDAADEGAILMFVLVMLTFVGIGVGPMLSAAFTATRAAVIAQASGNGLYAADGGVEYAIADLRAGVAACNTAAVTSAGPLFAPAVLNGLPVVISATCSTATLTASPSSMSSILSATITSTASISSSAGGGANGSHYTATAVIDINEVAPARNTSVVSWSSNES